jgi:hypothetical protein
MGNKQSGLVKMAIGAAVFLFLGFIAVASLASAAESGGYYFIWYGPMIGGVYLFYRGLRQFFKSDDPPKRTLNITPLPTKPVELTQPQMLTPNQVGAKDSNNFKYCGFCGSQITQKAKFCNKCGKIATNQI